MPFTKNNPFGISGGNWQANTQANPPNGKNNKFELPFFPRADMPRKVANSLRQHISLVSWENKEKCRRTTFPRVALAEC